jgi:hypothetical protein
MSIAFEIKHIKGIPYYLHESTIHTFELDAGKPGARCTAIGTYDATTDSIVYYPDWRERVQSHLQHFRESLFTQERDKLRDSIIKPTKPRKAPRNPRKVSSRAKNPPSE